jgi:hypothetical protein
MGLFRADGYHNKSLSEDTRNLVTMGLADLYHLSYPLCTILGISEFPSFISNTSIVSINFRANLDAQNAGNYIYRV